MDSVTDLLWRSFPLLYKGLIMTLQVFVCAASISFACGIFFGILTCNRLKIPLISPIIESITFVLRGVPFFVQLLVVYFVLPDLIGINLEPFEASVLALGLCSSGYMAQLVRGAINATPIAQWEAAFALGYSTPRSLRHVILPQMFRTMLPSLNNELDSLLKSTSVVSSIGLLELTRMGMNLVSREMEPVPIYLAIACMYLIVSAVLNMLAKLLERKLAYATP